MRSKILLLTVFALAVAAAIPAAVQAEQSPAPAFLELETPVATEAGLCDPPDILSLSVAIAPAGCSCSLGKDSQDNTCSCNASGPNAECTSSGQGSDKRCTCSDDDGTIVCQIVDGRCKCE